MASMNYFLIITLVKGMFDLQIDKKKKQKTTNCLQ